MAIHPLYFQSVDGGFQGSNAIVNDSSEFYLDLGKTVSFATIDISNTGTEILNDYGNVLGIEVLIEDSFTNLGGGSQSNTFDTSLYHTSSGEYTDAITTSIDNDEPLAEPLIIGGEGNTWGKTWSTNDINNLKVKLGNPQEPNGTDSSIALRGTFVFVRITFDLPSPTGGNIIISNGKFILKQGKITL